MADETLIHEIEDSLKQEKLESFWKEYGATIIVGIILAIAVTAGFSGWQSWTQARYEEKTAVLFRALEKENAAGTLATLGQQGYDDHAALAALTAGGLMIQAGNSDAARAQFKEVDAAQSVSPLLHDLGTVMAAKLDWDKDDRGKATILLEKLKPVWSDQDNPWRWQARMVAAMINAHTFQNYEQARTHAAIVAAAENIPESMSSRAQSYYQLYNFYLARAADSPADEGQQKEQTGTAPSDNPQEPKG